MKSLERLWGKTGRTVWGNDTECQYIMIIGGRLLTYLLTGTDRLERTFCQITTCVVIQFDTKITNLSVTLTKK